MEAHRVSVDHRRDILLVGPFGWQLPSASRAPEDSPGGSDRQAMQSSRDWPGAASQGWGCYAVADQLSMYGHENNLMPVQVRQVRQVGAAGLILPF